MQSWVVFAASVAYIGLLFAIAWQGDRKPADARRSWRTPLLYSLSLAIYCSSWTFYGSVGRAASHGFDFLPIYIGPIMVVGFGWPVLAKMVRIAKSQNSVSISDFLAVRYGKSQAVAALVTVVAVIGIIPYLALQLKAVSTSYQVLTREMGGSLTDALAASARSGDRTALFVAGLMALFAILFGISNSQASEHHRGLMRAIAFESVVKLATFLTVGAAVTYVLVEQPWLLTSGTRAAVPPLPGSDMGHWSWWSMTIISGLAVLCLPRQFHVAVVENTHEGDVRAAAWLFPAYLVLINIFVVPVALAGLVSFGGDVANADSFVVSVPLHLGSHGLALLAFLGGLSAAMAMVVVDTVALSTMVSNDIVMPLMLRLSGDPSGSPQSRVHVLLGVRWTAVLLTLAFAYLYYRVVGETYSLTSIGLISFAAVAQFGPTLIGGLFWRRGNRSGAIAGIAVGFAAWFYTLVLPSVAAAGGLPAAFADGGPWGIAWLAPRQLFGIAGLDPLSHSAVVSLGLNAACYVLFSLATRSTLTDRRQAALFVDTHAPAYVQARAVPPAITLGELQSLAEAYLGALRARQAFAAFAAERWDDLLPVPSRRAGLDDIRFTERLLAGTIGAASARVVLAGSFKRNSLSRTDAVAMLDEASEAIRFNHSLLTATLENVRQGICVFDKDLRLAAWNRRFLELNDLPDNLVRIGTSLAEIVRFNAARGEYGHDGDMQNMLARQDRSALLDSDLYERRRPDGTILEIATNPMPNGGFVATFADVTDRHLAAEALARANEGLERKVAERTTALAAATAEAEGANLAKTRFLAAVSHDLLQPLHAARLFAAALADKYKDGLVGKMDASLRSVETLLGALLDVSKLDGGAIHPKPANFPLAPLLAALNEEFSAIAAEKGLRFVTVASTLAVHSDPTLLRRILQNLLANAVRYTRRGRVLVGCRRRGTVVRIEVWDSGIGIPENQIGEIFQEFRQLENGEGAGEKGLGLGLSIVERLARMLDHGLLVRSWPGRGSCFAIDLPLATGKSSARDLAAPADTARRRGFGGMTVLCIDNDLAVLEGMQALLSGWNCKVLTAASAAEALTWLGTAAPAVAIVDFHLDGGRTGLQAAAEIRAAVAGSLPVVVVTADRSEAVKDEVDALGYALAYKPVRPAALRALLTRVVAVNRAAE